MIHDWFRQPLVQFLLAGGLLFMLHDALRETTTDRYLIDLQNLDIPALESAWYGKYHRPATREEIRALVEQRIREEVLLREALSLGLEESDQIIRRRLVQLMEFLADRVEMDRPVAETELREHYQTHLSRYMQPARYDFRQIPFASDAGGKARLQAVLSRLQQVSQQSDWNRLGDPSLLPRSWDGRTETEIGNVFGQAFAAEMARLSPGRWHGPVHSRTGVHLVYLEAVEPATPLPLEKVRAQVLQDIAEQRRQQARERLVRQLLENYQVVWPAELASLP